MRLTYRTDDGIARRARLGLIVLQVDETVESEFHRLTAIDGVAVYVSRVPSGAQLNEETILAMEAEIPAAACLFPPVAEFGVIGYACTSGATIIGPRNVAAAVRNAGGGHRFAGAVITDPLTAVKAAARALNVIRLGFVSPYVPGVSAAMRAALEADGFTISTFGSFEQSEEAVVARISAQSVYDAMLRVGQSADCDAVFVSCTNIRTLEVLPDAEQALGLPIVTSNQALAWHMLRLAGIEGQLPDHGRLMSV